MAVHSSISSIVKEYLPFAVGSDPTMIRRLCLRNSRVFVRSPVDMSSDIFAFNITINDVTLPQIRWPCKAQPSRPRLSGHQRLWDQVGDLSNGGFLAHRNPKESEDEPASNSKKLRKTGRAFLTPQHAGVVFPAPRVPTPLPDTFLQLCNRATTPMPASCMVAWLQQNEERGGMKDSSSPELTCRA